MESPRWKSVYMVPIVLGLVDRYGDTYLREFINNYGRKAKNDN